LAIRPAESSQVYNAIDPAERGALRLVRSESLTPPPPRSDGHGDVAARAGGRAALDAGAARPGLGLAAAQRAEQQPQVQQHAGPARRQLHPEGRPAAVGEGRLQHGRLVAGETRRLTFDLSASRQLFYSPPTALSDLKDVLVSLLWDGFPLLDPTNKIIINSSLFVFFIPIFFFFTSEKRF